MTQQGLAFLWLTPNLGKVGTIYLKIRGENGVYYYFIREEYIDKRLKQKAFKIDLVKLDLAVF